jgi:hypothetical protein
MTLIKFLERMRGALIDAPRILLPVMKIPHAAPMTCDYNEVRDRDLRRRRGESSITLGIGMLVIHEVRGIERNRLST